MAVWRRFVPRRLYWRIWLVVALSVAALSALVGLAWHTAVQERERRPPREAVLSDASGVESLVQVRELRLGDRKSPAAPAVLITLPSGEELTLQLAPRRSESQQRLAARIPAALRPPWSLWWVLLFSALAVMVGVFPITRRMARRLEALQRAVERWGAGELALRVPADGNDEAADLARHFNAAAAHIQSLMEAQAALLQSQKSLLANASHELRSPLARIRMAIELLPNADDARRAELQRDIAELDQLIDEILLASRLDARQADMGTVEELDLLALTAEECARSGVEMVLARGVTQLPVRGVDKLLRRAIRNLLHNALRYGGGAVRATLATEGAHAVLHVDDEGLGVPEDERERIFEPFYRARGASEREGGWGLGLALVRSIAQRHGGSACCGAHAGRGARFTLRLPLAAQ